MIWQDLCAFALFNIGYATYLETNPQIKGVILRPDENGNRKISLKSYWNFIKQPFKSDNTGVQKELWKPKNWDINYFMSATIFMLHYKATTSIVEHIRTNPPMFNTLDNPIFQESIVSN